MPAEYYITMAVLAGVLVFFLLITLWGLQVDKRRLRREQVLRQLRAIPTSCRWPRRDRETHQPMPCHCQMI